MSWYSILAFGPLFLLSLLSVFKAPTYRLWLLSIIVTEYPLFFVIPTFFLTFWIQNGTLTGIVISLIFFSPVVRAYLISRNLKQNLIVAFGLSQSNNITTDESTFHFWKL